MSKNYKGGLDQYGAERFGRLILPLSEKCGTERVKRFTRYPHDYCIYIGMDGRTQKTQKHNASNITVTVAQA